MDPVALTVGLSWTIAGLLCVAAALPLAMGKVGRNPFYGVRLPQSFQSDEAWDVINRFGGRRMVLWSIPLVAIGGVCLFLPLRAHPGLTVILGFAPLVFVLMPVIESWRFARRFPKV